MQRSHITAATLNYCDIMNNPFEFYCQDFEKELVEISQIFVRLLPLYFPDFNKKTFSWGMGKIDQKVRIGRYSPAFSLNVGIGHDRFLTREEFESKWEEEFEKVIQGKEIPYKETERETTKLYDFILYHTLLSFAFKDDSFQELIKNSPEHYLDIYRPFYDLSFLSQERKLNKFMNNFTKIQADVFFVQQYSPLLVERLRQMNKYHLVTDDARDKLLIVKKETFKEIKALRQVLTEEQIKNLDWSEGPAILVAQHSENGQNFFIMNAHLTSKTEKNKVQLAHMKQSLLQIKAAFPNYNFIVGGDINSFMGADGSFQKVFNFYPLTENELTTIKRRTMAQGQYHKGDKTITESKDKVISNLKIEKGAVRYINSTEASSKSLIPTNEHPFDHFVVMATLQLA